MAGLKSKSPAEFFAENQNIAGFDNPGKSLYTTVREFVENSLDAAESIGVLPDVELNIEQLDQSSFNKLRGYASTKRKDLNLYHGSSKKRKIKEGVSQATGSKKGKERSSKEGKNTGIFRVTCRDNGVGMPHEKIPRMLGIVLSSTKYGVKQTRGKFGLGAKMALVWAKKSTGMPVEVKSAREGMRISRCKLDININKNEPKTLLHERLPNPDGWRGTEISVVISGNWTNYRSKIINYMRQLAVITPYSSFKFNFKGTDSRRSVRMEFTRRSDRCPRLPKEVKHHPSSVNNLIMESLVSNAKKNMGVAKFLQKNLSCISAKLSGRLVEELGADFEDLAVGDLSEKQIHQLTTLLREASFPQPDGSCLSPAGEYNLRLGIMKELKPDVVATFSEKVSVREGHPFIVEAAVSLGGSIAKPGIVLYRYANRIPLLFEQGNDISSQIASKKIRWASYKINKNNDKIGVFVSIVSTKIPFKGTSKEYIGDDNGPLHKAVKHSIAQCCVQLRKELTKKNALKDQAERKKALTKYIPDVARALMTALNTFSTERKTPKDVDIPGLPVGEVFKETRKKIMNGHRDGSLNEKVLRSQLETYVKRIDETLALEFATEKGRNPKNLDNLFIARVEKNQTVKLEEVTSPNGFTLRLLV